MNSAPPKIYGLIGYPVKHSFSPAMHNAAFQFRHINAEYKLFEKKTEELETFLHSLSEQNIYGLNVTVPYKEKVLKFLDYLSIDAKAISAVNTIVREDNKLKGFNTDIDGFLYDLVNRNRFGVSNKKVALLGAGGAARAVSYALVKSEAKAKEIAIFDIDKNKSESVAAMIRDLSPKFKICVVDSIEELDIPNKDVLINATPVGLNDTDPCLVSEGMLHKGLFVYDLIYNPPETKLLTLAKKIGARTSNGLGMLYCQGARAFQHFTGIRFSAVMGIMRQALEKELNKCQK
jgi:shikimate dehydrogenase